jgi:hypothetical protein
MSSESEPLWPYLLLAVGWSAACAYMLIRARASRRSASPPSPPAATDSMPPTTASQFGQWERDTQAGRM